MEVKKNKIEYVWLDGYVPEPTLRSKIKIIATDLDIIFSKEIPTHELKKEGSTTTSANILYDILRKLQPNAKVE